MIMGVVWIIFMLDYVEIKNICGGFEINGDWYLLNLVGDFYWVCFEGNNVVWNIEKEKILFEFSGK